MKKSKHISLFFLCFFIALIVGCEKERTAITNVSQLNDPSMVITAGNGSRGYLYAKEKLPKAKLKILETPESIIELRNKKIAAYVHDDYSLTSVLEAANIKDLKVLIPEDADTVKICVGVSRVTKIPHLREKLDAFIDSVRSVGTLEQIQDYWKDEKALMPDFPKLEKPSGKLVVATSAIVTPYTFYKNGKLAGVDIQLARMFAQSINYDVEFKVFDYGSIVVAATSGNVDCIFANLNWTQERAEAIDFTKPYHQVLTAVLVLKESSGKQKEVYRTLEDFRFKKIGVQTGTSDVLLIQDKIGDFNPAYFNAANDMVLALQEKKLDAVAIDFAPAQLYCSRYPELSILLDVDQDQYGFAFTKGSPVVEQFNQALDKLFAQGTIDSISKKWTTNSDEEMHSIDQDWESPNGTLVVGGAFEYPPLALIVDGKPAGIDVDVLYRVGKEIGYRMDIRDMGFDAILPSLAAGKLDIAASGISISDERKETIDFSRPYYKGTLSILVRKENTELAGNMDLSATPKVGFIDGLKESFDKNFVREARWKMILSGLGISILISVCSGVIGIILGFGVCMLRRSRNKLSVGSNIVFVKVIQGTPIVVLLMIVYYVVFGSIDIPGVIAAIVGFSINFAAYTSEMIRTGLETVDKGQVEASYAIGFNKTQTFWKVVFPQAARNFLPVVRGEFISLLKNTSIVGYIAVVDLTKASDIIRSRTMEAFFPLVMTALIYFFVSWLFTFGLGVLEKRLDPKSRRRVK